MPGLLQRLAPLANEAATHKAELAGLGVLALPSLDEAQAHARAAMHGDYNSEGVKKRTLLPHAAKPASEIAGLGILAGPSAAHLLSKHAFLDELMKLGAISDDQARRSLDRLDSLERSAPTVGQVGRYGALGAGAGALTKAIGHSIEHGHLPTSRAALGGAAAGAVGMGAVPLIRGALDRHAETSTLKKYMQQPEKMAADTFSIDTPLIGDKKYKTELHKGDYAKTVPPLTDV